MTSFEDDLDVETDGPGTIGAGGAFRFAAAGTVAAIGAVLFGAGRSLPSLAKGLFGLALVGAASSLVTVVPATWLVMLALPWIGLGAVSFGVALKLTVTVGFIWLVVGNVFSLTFTSR